ncbi:MAG: hypothetical protein JWM14_729 [Chitinophagaceae bacterium]|nr:hypothetical protein [Chitinophagaceae bacterium]
MDKKKIIFIVFCLVVAAQLYVPAKMVFDRDNILVTGKPFKFKAAPIDPSDPLRGKYIVLNFEATSVPVAQGTDWSYESPVYLELTNDSSGYAMISAAHHEEPSDATTDYILAKVSYFNNNDNTLSIQYPFNRYYMEESKAQDAEDLYRHTAGDSTQVTYALVYVKNGEAVLKDVLVNDMSIKDILKETK